MRTVGVVRESFAGDKSALGIQCDRGGEPLVRARLEAEPGNPFCPGDRDQAIENLKTSYGEEVEARGLSNDGKVMFELLTSKDGSWTLLMTHADGKTCLVGSGQSWTAVTAMKAKGPAV